MKRFSKHLAIYAFSLIVAMSMLLANSETLSMRSFAQAVQASSADAFVDSIGVNVHWTFPSYTSNIAALKLLLGQSGIRHQRDLANASDATQRAIVADLYSTYGIKSTMLLFPPAGTIPSAAYWSGVGPGSTKTVNQYLAYMPAGSIAAMEMPNELDIFYGLYRWHPADPAILSTNPADATYYGDYGVAVTQDTWAAVRADSQWNNVKIVGPSVGVQVPSPFPDGSLYDYVDYGSFHPYPARVNAFNTPLPYGGIVKYYWNSFQPSGNISTDPPYNTTPLLFDWYQPAFISGPNERAMWATETGYSNGSSWFPTLATTKHVPRLFAEYFRNGIARTFYYELFDESNDPDDGEDNDGLVYNNLTPKPAYTALASLIDLLKEPGASFTPGLLDYSLSVAPFGAYTRTEYVHDLLLQKSDGDFYLLLWHEISNSSDTDIAGNPIVGVQRDITHPALTTTITLPENISSATVYTYGPDWTLSPAPLAINGLGEVTVPATDMLSVLALRASPVETHSVGNTSFWVGTMPGSTTTIATGTVLMSHASFSTGGSSATITLSDRSGECGGMDCEFMNAVPIAANTTYEIDLKGQIAPGGLKISATGTVAARIQWTR